MRTYLATLHKRSDEHKRRFALLTSGGFTLVIFAIWAFVNFGSLSGNPEQVTASANQANPFGSFLRGVGESFKSLVGKADELKGGLEMVDFKSGYEELKNGSLNSYGE